MMELVTRAIIFAAKAHDGTRHKKSAVPYILHPMDAAAIVGSLTDKQEILANCTAPSGSASAAHRYAFFLIHRASNTGKTVLPLLPIAGEKTVSAMWKLPLKIQKT